MTTEKPATTKGICEAKVKRPFRDSENKFSMIMTEKPFPKDVENIIISYESAETQEEERLTDKPLDPEKWAKRYWHINREIDIANGVYPNLDPAVYENYEEAVPVPIREQNTESMRRLVSEFPQMFTVPATRMPELPTDEEMETKLKHIIDDENFSFRELDRIAKGIVAYIKSLGGVK